MADFFQTGAIATLHRLGPPSLPRLEAELVAGKPREPRLVVGVDDLAGHLVDRRGHAGTTPAAGGIGGGAMMRGFRAVLRKEAKQMMLAGEYKALVDKYVADQKALIDGLAPGGGYIFSSSNSIHDGVKLENLYAMLDTVKSYGKYLRES